MLRGDLRSLDLEDALLLLGEDATFRRDAPLWIAFFSFVLYERGAYNMSMRVRLYCGLEH